MGAARQVQVPRPARERVRGDLHPLRASTTLGLLLALEVLAVRATADAWRVLAAPPPASLPEAVLAVVLAAGVLLGAWLLLGTAVAVAGHLPGRVGATCARWASTWAPVVARRAAAVLVGAALGTGTAASGSAATAPVTAATTLGSAAMAPVTAVGLGPGPAAGPGFAATPPAPGPSTAGPGWTPTRPVHPPARATRLVAGAGAPPAGEVVVRRGDSLWGIVRRHLGPGATEAEVAAAWPRWHAANRAVVGPDPDLLLPGQVLRAPDPLASTETTASTIGQPDGARR